MYPIYIHTPGYKKLNKKNSGQSTGGWVGLIRLSKTINDIKYFYTTVNCMGIR